MGRLDDIIDRNKNPRKHGKMRFPWGIMMAAFVLLILVLMIFTDLDESPDVRAREEQPQVDPEPGRVRGIGLMKAPTQRRDAGND